MSKNPKNEQSPKQQAIAERNETAYQLIEAGVKHSAATGIIQRRFNVGRSTAYNVVQHAQIQFEDFQRHTSEMPEPAGIDPQEVATLLALQLQNAFADGDTKAMVQITKEMDRIRKWSAPLQTPADPLQSIPGFGRANSIAEKQQQNDAIRSSVVTADRDTMQLTAIQQSKKAKELAKRERELDEREASHR